MALNTRRDFAIPTRGLVHEIVSFGIRIDALIEQSLNQLNKLKLVSRIFVNLEGPKV